jgi:hypothetical protein
MTCPFCKQTVYGLTGLREIQNFQDHLNKKCRENPKRKTIIDPRGNLVTIVASTSMEEALTIRADSGQ